MFRRVLLLSLVLTALLGVSAASAQTGLRTCATNDVYARCTPGFIVDPPNTTVAGQVTISGQGCDANQLVVFSIGSQEIGRTTSDNLGRFTVTITLPPTLGPGTYTITGTCGNTIMSNVITVDIGGIVNNGVRTPITGSDPGPLVRGGLLLIVGGGLVLVASKRGREREPVRTRG